MNAQIEVSIKFDDDKKAKKFKISVPNVQSKWLKKDVKNLPKWASLMLSGIHREFPQAR